MEIAKEEFEKYEKVRQSGVTNMADIKMVKQLSGLEKDKIMEIKGSYGDLGKKYPDVRGK